MMSKWVKLVVTGTLLAMGCQESQQGGVESKAPASQQAESPGARSGASGLTGGGTIEARVTYKGEPMVETVRVLKDVEQCGSEQVVEKLVIGPEGGLQDVVISVADSSVTAPASAAPPTLDQKGCKFRPNVLAMMPGEVEILNSDGILHNIHTSSDNNPPINKAQPKFKKVMTERLAEPDIVRVRCDVHSWMEGWIVVRATPLLAVTDGSGHARIEHVPAGKQTVELWHPVAGRRTVPVEVKAGETVTVTVDFPAVKA
jgi:plastocyanin